MEAVPKDYWYFLVLMIFFSFLKDTLQQKLLDATVKLEDGMILDCQCPWAGNLVMVSWSRKPGNSKVAVYHPDYGMDLAEGYERRVEFLKTSPLDGSISISNVTEDDAGIYHCSLQTFPKGSWTKDILVENIVSIATIQPDSEVVVEESENLTIRCNHVHNGTVYQVSIEKLGERSSSIIAMCKVEDGSLVGEDYTERVRVNCSDAMDVSLRLTDVIEEDEGLYRCRFSTDAGIQTTTILLTTVPNQEFRNPEHMIYIYIGGGVSGLVLVIVILMLIWWHRRKNRGEEYQVKLHPAKRQQRNNYEQGALYDRMEKGKKHRGDSPVYANIQRIQLHTKRKR